MKICLQRIYLDKVINLFEKNKELKGETNNQLMNYEKVNKYFGWEPKIDFHDGLDITIEWFRKYMDIYYNDLSPLYKL